MKLQFFNVIQVFPRHLNSLKYLFWCAFVVAGWLNPVALSAQSTTVFQATTPLNRTAGKIANSAALQTRPHYHIQVHYNADKRRLTGTVRVEVPQDWIKQGQVVFALPMNRFQAKDPRGPRVILQTPTFALDSFKELEDDPLFPRGFSAGSIRVKRVLDGQGNSLGYSLRENPNLPVGFYTGEGLLEARVQTSDKEQTLVLEFETFLPERYEEGQVKDELVTALWHPLLLPQDGSKAQFALLEPVPAFYDVEFSSKTQGTLITTSDLLYYLTSNGRLQLQSPKRAVKYFPMVFSPSYSRVIDPDQNWVHSLYLTDSKRRAELLMQWGVEFTEFMRKEYGLPNAWDNLKVVEVRGDHEQIQVINNLVLVSTPHYHRTQVLDRRVLGFFSRGLAQLWFGETVFNNENHQLWVSRGLTSFFGLKFFQHKFGQDAGIFDWINWLNPRYKEHFYEEMVRSINRKLLVPIVHPIQDNQDPRHQLRVITYKTALVMNMLEFVTKKSNFNQAIQRFYEERHLKLADDRQLQQAMEQVSGEQLDWFFKQWFHGTKRMDYSLKEIRSEELGHNLFRVRVIIENKDQAAMPIPVELKTEDGRIFRERSERILDRGEVVFTTTAPPEEASLDPDEILMETERINNYSYIHYRVRFAFDWKKEREVMVLLIPRIGSNAFDGNAYGLEARNHFGKTFFSVTPGYGTKSNMFVYLMTISRSQFLHEDAGISFNASRIAGEEAKGFKLDYNTPFHRNHYSYGFAFEIEHEYAFSTEDDDDNTDSSSDTATTDSSTVDDEEEQEEDELEDTGETSNYTLTHSGSWGSKNWYYISYQANLERPMHALGADFNYNRLSGRVMHVFHAGFRKLVRWVWIMGATAGDAPLQKQHQLGSPQVLRGYPQRTKLRDDRLLAMRLDFEFPIMSSPLWGNISSKELQGILFYDRGRVWPNDGDYESAKIRQDAGVGIQWGLDAYALFQLPLKLELAYPLGDDEFDKPQFVLAGVLSFF